MDAYGDHCLSCCEGGDRTRRHNLIRNMVYKVMALAGLLPELERPGLLPARPLCGGSHEDGTKHGHGPSDDSARRPADVFAPRWRSGLPAAFDFAVTSGLNQDVLSASARNAEAACNKYEDRKRSYKDTAQICSDQGLTFVPMVLEAVGGGWGKEARKVWSELAKLSAHAAGKLETESGNAVSFLQRFAVILHRENARAVLRRLAPVGQLLDMADIGLGVVAMEVSADT